MKRDVRLDIAKGLLISMVVLFHLPNIELLTSFDILGSVICTAYMPAFFIVSGVLHKDKPLGIIIKSLMIPYLFFYFLAVVVELLKQVAKGNSIDFSSIASPFLGYTLGYQNTAIWFLLVLCMIKLLFPLLNKIKRNHYAVATSLFISLLGYVFGKHFGSYPYYISVALLCQFFYFTAYRYKDYILCRTSVAEVLIECVVLIVLNYIWPYACNVSQNYIPIPFIVFIVMAIAFIRVVMGVSTLLAQYRVISSIISFYGMNSLIVFGTHLLFIGLTSVIARLIEIPDLYLLITSVCILAIEVPIIYGINRYAKFLIGK